MEEDENETAIFNYIPDGEDYYATVHSDYYFDQNWSFNTSDLATDNSHTFVMRQRVLNVNLFDFERFDFSASAENITVALFNSTGYVSKNTTNCETCWVNGTTVTGSISFEGIMNGEYNISITADNYTPMNYSFNPASGDNNNVDLYLKRKNHSYLYVTVLSGSSALESATVTSICNDSIELISMSTNSSGVAMVSANISYCNNISVSVSKSGYYDNRSLNYSLTDQQVTGINITLSSVPSSGPLNQNPGGGTTGGTTLGGTSDAETQSLGDMQSGVAGSVDFSTSETLKITSIEVTPSQAVSGASITVRSSGKPSGASDAVASSEGDVYKYLDITTSNLEDALIDRVRITFKVSRTWINENSIDPDEVYLFRYSGGYWERLQTSRLSDDDSWYYYRSASSGFSIYAIGGYFYAEEGMSVQVSPLYMEGGQCRNLYISVRNRGSSSLTNVYASLTEPECCTVETSGTVSTVSPRGQETIPVSVCVSQTSDKGGYDYTVTVHSDQVTETIDTTIYVTSTYLEVLESQMAELETLIEDLKISQLNMTEQEYYSIIEEKIAEMREELDRQRYDSALRLLQEAREYYDRIKMEAPEPGYLDSFMQWMIANYIMVIIASALIVSIMSTFLLRKRISSLVKGMPKMPSGGDVVKGVVREGGMTFDSLMAIVRDLEGRIDAIDIESLRENEKKWYNRIKVQIEYMKKSIQKGDFERAKRNLNDAELYMKIMELSSSSGDES